MGRDKKYPLTSEIEENLKKLLLAIHRFQEYCPFKLNVSSGYRPAEFNTKAGGAKNSHHMFCAAVDFHDVDGAIKRFCAENIPVLEECGLYMESQKHTPTWCHLQIKAPVSGKRVFIP